MHRAERSVTLKGKHPVKTLLKTTAATSGLDGLSKPDLIGQNRAL
jgi:hypothetical protein